MRFLKIAAISVGIVMFGASPALAQRAQNGSVIVMDYERVLTTSVAGRDVEAKLRQIAEQMQAELQPEQTAVQTEAQALQTATRGQTQEQIQRNSSLNQRVTAFNTRAEAFRAQQVTRARDLEYTRQQALQEFNRQVEPIVTEVMNARRAGVVVDRSSVQIMAEGVDATADIISRLDQRVRTINVTRQAAPAPQQPAAPAR